MNNEEAHHTAQVSDEQAQDIINLPVLTYQGDSEPHYGLVQAGNIEDSKEAREEGIGHGRLSGAFRS